MLQPVSKCSNVGVGDSFTPAPMKTAEAAVMEDAQHHLQISEEDCVNNTVDTISAMNMRARTILPYRASLPCIANQHRQKQRLLTQQIRFSHLILLSKLPAKRGIQHLIFTTTAQIDIFANVNSGT